VQEGNFFTEVPGASTPLIVRMIHGKELLVSAAILKGERMILRGWEKMVFV
jgi:hypothetical protein